MLTNYEDLSGKRSRIWVSSTVCFVRIVVCSSDLASDLVKKLISSEFLYYINIYIEQLGIKAWIELLRVKDGLSTSSHPLALFERAYLMYFNSGVSIEKTQFPGWEEYMIRFCQRENFRETWGAIKATYDSRFVHYLDMIIKKKALSA